MGKNSVRLTDTKTEERKKPALTVKKDLPAVSGASLPEKAGKNSPGSYKKPADIGKTVLFSFIAALALAAAFCAVRIAVRMTKSFVPLEEYSFEQRILADEAVISAVGYYGQELLFENSDTAGISFMLKNTSGGEMRDIELTYELPFGLENVGDNSAFTIKKLAPGESTELIAPVKKESFTKRRFDGINIEAAVFFGCVFVLVIIIAAVRSAGKRRLLKAAALFTAAALTVSGMDMRISAAQVTEERTPLTDSGGTARGALCSASVSGESALGKGKEGFLGFTLKYTLEERLELSISESGKNSVKLEWNDMTGVKSRSVERSPDNKEFTGDSWMTGNGAGKLSLDNEGKAEYFRVCYKLSCGNVYSNTALAVRGKNGIFTDSDSDGLSDRLENAFGTSPRERYTNGGSITDLEKIINISGEKYPDIDVYKFIEEESGGKGALMLNTLLLSAASEEPGGNELTVGEKMSAVAAGIIAGEFAGALSSCGYIDKRYIDTAYFAAGGVIAGSVKDEELVFVREALVKLAEGDAAAARQSLSRVKLDDEAADGLIRLFCDVSAERMTSSPEFTCHMLHALAKAAEKYGLSQPPYAFDAFVRRKIDSGMSGLSASARKSLEKYAEYRFPKNDDQDTEKPSLPGEDNAQDDLKRAVIIVPGIMASELAAGEDTRVGLSTVKEGELVWMPGGMSREELSAAGESFSFNALTKLINSVMMLYMNGSGMSGYNVCGKEVSPDDESVGTDGVATSMYKRLRSEFKDRDVIFFSYDWRKSVLDSAAGLQALINKNGYDSVTFVCHSMGGVVVSAYLSANDDNLRKADKVITIGTPYGGSAESMYMLLTGNMTGAAFIDEVCKTLIKNMPGIYELLPYKRSFSNGGYLVKDGKELDADATAAYINSELNKKLYARASNVEERIYGTGTHVMNKKEVESYIIAGTGVSTPYRMYVGKGGFESAEYSGDGDGDVLLSSALKPDGEYLDSPIYLVNGVRHTDLLSDTDVISLVVGIINNGEKAAYSSPKITKPTRKELDTLIVW